MRACLPTPTAHCGTVYADPSRYPRHCESAHCGASTWFNPLPVSVVLVPVRHDERAGVLVVRRAIEPQRGRLAIVGGFVDDGETWQAAGAREVREETGVVITPSDLDAFWFTSTEPRPNRVLLFSVARPLDAAILPAFEASDETSERGLVFGPGGLAEVLAFPLHVAALERYFHLHEVAGPHAYVTL